MVTKQVIETLYKKYHTQPASPDELNLALLFDYAFDNHGIIIDENDLYITSIDPSSPFACIPLDRICEIVEFSEVVAIVLPAAIVFLNKRNPEVNIHIKMEKPSLWERIRMTVMRENEDEEDHLVMLAHESL